MEDEIKRFFDGLVDFVITTHVINEEYLFEKAGITFEERTSPTKESLKKIRNIMPILLEETIQNGIQKRKKFHSL